jgi:hypothetical protein
MSEADMLRLLDRAGQASASLVRTKAKIMIETNPVAAWANDVLIHEPNAKTYVGVCKELPFNRGYENENVWLFPNYTAYMKVHGHHPVTSVTFSGRLEDLCRSQLKLEGVCRNRDATGSHFEGVRMRQSGDTAGLLIETALFAIGNKEMLGDVGLMLEQVIDNVEDVVYVGYSQTSIEGKEEKKKEPSFPSSSPPVAEKNFSQNPTFPVTSTFTMGLPNINPTLPNTPNIDPTLPVSDRTACPQCGCATIKWGVSTGTCQQCKAVFGGEPAVTVGSTVEDERCPDCDSVLRDSDTACMQCGRSLV